MNKFCLRTLRGVLSVLGCVCLTGCFDTTQEIFLNPDGSGKAVIESSFVPVESLFDHTGTAGGHGPSNFARKVIADAEGVEAWREVSFREQEDGRVSFRGTAYFTDLSRLKVNVTAFSRFSVTKDAAGFLTIAPMQDASALPNAPPGRNEPATEESIQRERRQFRAARPWLAATLGALQQETVFRVPGVVRSASNFETNTPRTLRLRVDGARLMQVLEEVLFDAEFARKRLAGGASSNLLANNPSLNEKLYGQRAPLRAVIQPGRQPLFDYATEVAEAHREFPGIARQLGLAASVRESVRVSALPALEGAPARVKVTGIQWNFAGDANHGSRGYTLSLAAELPGTVLSVNKVGVERAVTVEGANLLSPQRFGYGLSRSGFSKTLTNVNFTVQLEAPAVDSRGISELSGVLECTGAGSLRTVDLIPAPLRDGTRGREFGAQLDEVRTHVSGGHRVVLRTRLAPEQLWSLKAVSDSGQSVSLEKRGLMAIGQERVYTYTSARPIPRGGRLVAEVMTDAPSGSETLRIPFSVTNFTLLGQPLAAK